MRDRCSFIIRWLTLVVTLAFLMASKPSSAASSLADVIDSAQPKMVKIYGAGGLRGLESYQSGFLISSEGHVLTVWSYVLDTDFISVTLNDGRKFDAELLGQDPRLEIAILKIDAAELDYYNLDEAVELEAGARVLAFCNMFGVATGNEPASVLHGSVSIKADLAARRGAYQMTYRGPVYVLDAMTNNPGAAGGALCDNQGRLAGILGKELRNSLSNTWLNFSIPVAELTGSVDDILSGKIIPRRLDENAKKSRDPLTLSLLGLVLVPDVLTKTPPFIDRVRSDSFADRSGLKADDLVLFINNRIVPSCQALRDELSFIDRDDVVHIMVQRGQDLVEVIFNERN